VIYVPVSGHFITTVPIGYLLMAGLATISFKRFYASLVPYPFSKNSAQLVYARLVPGAARLLGIADAATWHVAQIGDLNGDTKDDILFRNDTGHFYSWDMDGTHIQTEGALPWADPSQHIVTQHWDLV
jgi:hypothetical protein